MHANIQYIQSIPATPASSRPGYDNRQSTEPAINAIYQPAVVPAETDWNNPNAREYATAAYVDQTAYGNHPSRSSSAQNSQTMQYVPAHQSMGYFTQAPPSVYTTQPNYTAAGSIYAAHPGGSIFAAQPGGSIFAAQPGGSIFAGQPAPVYAIIQAPASMYAPPQQYITQASLASGNTAVGPVAPPDLSSTPKPKPLTVQTKDKDVEPKTSSEEEVKVQKSVKRVESLTQNENPWTMQYWYSWVVLTTCFFLPCSCMGMIYFLVGRSEYREGNLLLAEKRRSSACRWTSTACLIGTVIWACAIYLGAVQIHYLKNAIRS